MTLITGLCTELDTEAGLRSHRPRVQTLCRRSSRIWCSAIDNGNGTSSKNGRHEWNSEVPTRAAIIGQAKSLPLFTAILTIASDLSFPVHSQDSIAACCSAPRDTRQRKRRVSRPHGLGSLSISPVISFSLSPRSLRPSSARRFLPHTSRGPTHLAFPLLLRSVPHHSPPTAPATTA